GRYHRLVFHTFSVPSGPSAALGAGQLHVLAGPLRPGGQRQRQHLHAQRHRRGPLHRRHPPVQGRLLQEVGGHHHQHHLGRRDRRRASGAAVLLGGGPHREQHRDPQVRLARAGQLAGFSPVLQHAAGVFPVPAAP
ncbi:unnamed protein product, partial [Lymnaea stagnalis]